MNYHGVVIGAAAFLVIGLFHPIVIKAEFHFGKRIWPVFLAVGVAAVIISLFIGDVWVAALGVVGFSSLWSIREIFEQTRKVENGWVPENPSRNR
ncbi:DUF4491 family protein [Candidatus Bipolaricaulota bacterium]|nr:DUF4491 family protein [Candidatus Bipolaricaulota bacterium]